MVLFQNSLRFFRTDFSAVSASLTLICFFLRQVASGVCGLRIDPGIFGSAPENLLKTCSTSPHASSSKASHLDGLSSPQAQASGDAKRALAETSVEAAAMVTVKARAMAAAMAAANATVMAATTAVAAAMATASDSCVEGICVVNVAVLGDNLVDDGDKNGNEVRTAVIVAVNAGGFLFFWLADVVSSLGYLQSQQFLSLKILPLPSCVLPPSSSLRPMRAEVRMDL